MTHIKVNHIKTTNVTRMRDSDDSWDSDDLSHTHSFDGYKIVTDKDYFDFILTD